MDSIADWLTAFESIDDLANDKMFTVIGHTLFFLFALFNIKVVTKDTKQFLPLYILSCIMIFVFNPNDVLSTVQTSIFILIPVTVGLFFFSKNTPEMIRWIILILISLCGSNAALVTYGQKTYPINLDECKGIKTKTVVEMTQQNLGVDAVLNETKKFDSDVTNISMTEDEKEKIQRCNASIWELPQRFLNPQISNTGLSLYAIIYYVIYALGTIYALNTRNIIEVIVEFVTKIITLITEFLKALYTYLLPLFEFIKNYFPSPQLAGVQLNTFLVILVGIILYFYARTISKQYYGGTLLSNQPVPLNQRTSFSVNDKREYEYTLSCWMYMNPISPGHASSSTEYTNVLLYGNNVVMAYNASLNRIKVVIKNQDKKETIEIKNIPLQTWNHYILTYTNGTFDFFMNGELKKSKQFVPSRSSHDLILGTEQGVSGEVCNVLFYNKVVPIETMKKLYTDFNTTNPPVV
jgi:hypothetical protein